MRFKVFLVLLSLAACGAFGWGLADGDTPGQTRYSFILTPDEIGLARDLAERDLPSTTLSSGPKIVFIKIDLLPDSQAESGQRLVMVHHYRYWNDQTIFTMVDLRSQEVLKQEFVAHFPSALAAEEVQRALQLAHADERLRHFFELIPTEFDARPIQFAAAQENFFGHRVVHVLMRQDGNYLANPRVLVDLTTETVHVETK
jgi:hypothetical protein